MTIIFQKNVRNNFMNAGFLCTQFNRSVSEGAASINYLTSFTIWDGAQPSAADLFTNWTSTYKTSWLVHLSSFNIWQPNASVADTGITATNFNLPVAAVAPRSGTATWGVLWSNSLSEASLTATTPAPQSYPRYVIIPISDTSGTYPVRMLTTSISAGTSYSIVDLTITAAGGIA